jgi:uncharacterized protein (TIGR03435 family)
MEPAASVARVAVILAVIAAVPETGASQTSSPELPVSASFEVASVKRHSDPATQMGVRVSDSRFSAVLTVRALIQLSYGYPSATLFNNQVVGGPAWINNDRFEINATLVGPLASAPGGLPVRLLAMERALLADRFRLKVHQETRQLPVFDLVVSRSDGRLGSRLTRSDGTCLPPTLGASAAEDRSRYCGVKRSVPGAISAKGLTLPSFAELLSFVPAVQRIVRDRTQLNGQFDLDVDFAPNANAPDAQAPSFFTALKEQLGLELKPATGPVNVVVIDSVEPPAPD